MQDYPAHIIETAAPELKQLTLLLLEKLEQQSNELLMLKQENVRLAGQSENPVGKPTKANA